MRRIAIAMMGTVSGLVLLFSYHTSLGPQTNASAQEGGGDGDGGSALAQGDGQVLDGGTGDGGGGANPDASPTTSPGATPTPSTGQDAGQDAGAVSGTFTGARVQTHWGPVRVRIVVQNGRIVKAQATEYPTENHHDQEINSWAIPQLQDATVQANSAQIDSLSGATVTSQGYIASLQSAIDKAHL